MKTFQEMIDNNEYTFPEVVDEATQGLLEDFFGLRIPVRHFERFFDRDLNLLYPYYREMLRIDPTSIEVDWFVQNYIEREVKGFHNENAIIDGNSTASETGSNVNVGYINGQHNGNKFGNNSHVINETGNSSDSSNRTGNAHRDYDGQDATSTSDRTMKHVRNQPMSASYTSENLDRLNGKKVQVKGGGGTYEVTANSAEIAYPRIKNPTASEDGVTFHTGVGHNENHSTDTNSETQVNSHNSSGNKVDSGTYNDSDTATDITNSTNTQTTNGSSQSAQHSQNSTEGNSTQREIMTGRSTYPAEVIEKARQAIASTSAYKYLIKSLDRNFKQCYNIDEYI